MALAVPLEVNCTGSSSLLRYWGYINERECDATSVLHRLRCNDPKLCALYVGTALIDVSADPSLEGGASALTAALTRHKTLRSLSVYPAAYQRLLRQRSETGVIGDYPLSSRWAQLLRACYHLPLRSLDLESLAMSEEDLYAVTLLVLHLCGAEDFAAPRPHQSLDSTNAEMSLSEHNTRPSREGSLTTLSLSGNVVPPDLARRLGTALAHPCSSLRHINLSHCELHDKGLASLLGEVLNEGSTYSCTSPHAGEPRSLAIQWNKLTAASDSVLVRCLHHPQLTLRLEGNHLSATVYRQWQLTVKTPLTLMPFTQVHSNEKESSRAEQQDRSQLPATVPLSAASAMSSLEWMEETAEPLCSQTLQPTEATAVTVAESPCISARPMNTDLPIVQAVRDRKWRDVQPPSALASLLAVADETCNQAAVSQSGGGEPNGKAVLPPLIERYAFTGSQKKYLRIVRRVELAHPNLSLTTPVLPKDRWEGLRATVNAQWSAPLPTT